MARSLVSTQAIIMFTCLLLVCAAGAATESEAPVSARVTSPMIQEILDNHAASQIRVAELVARLEGTTDQEQILALEREIEMEKIDSQMEMIRIQVRYARNRGDGQTVARLEAGLVVMAKQMETRAGTSLGANH